MKPHRIKMAHNLILNYGLDKKMDVLVSDSDAHPCPAETVALTVTANLRSVPNAPQRTR